MPKFEVQPIGIKKKDNSIYDHISTPLAKPPLSMVVLARRRQGKSTVAVNLLMNGGYVKTFREVLIISETIENNKTYQPLSKYDTVSVHDITQHPIDNALLEAIWKRQKRRFQQDRKNDLLIIFDDLGSKTKSRECVP